VKAAPLAGHPRSIPGWLQSNSGSLWAVADIGSGCDLIALHTDHIDEIM
jgi:hypothetical protein